MPTPNHGPLTARTTTRQHRPSTFGGHHAADGKVRKHDHGDDRERSEQGARRRACTVVGPALDFIFRF